jgi:hypothetical protein
MFWRQNPVSETLILKNKQDGTLDKHKMMDNVQKHNICTNIPSPPPQKNKQTTTTTTKKKPKTNSMALARK